jgi:hypothetical protein
MLAAFIEEPCRLLAQRYPAFMRFGRGDEPLCFAKRVPLVRAGRLPLGMHVQPHVIEVVASWDEPGLAGSRLKLARATELFSVLQAEALQFRLNGQLVKANEREESDDLGNRWAVVYCESVAEIPLRFSLLAGDVVHNLRSALDHAVYQLVRRDKGKPTTRTAWPVFTEKPVGRVLAKYNANLKGIKDKDVRTMIDWFQPYQRPSNLIREGLAQLHELDIVDKHRVIRPGVAVLTAVQPTAHVLVSAGEIKPGNELFRVPESARLLDVAIRYQFAFWEDQITTDGLGKLIEIVKGTIDKVGVFFGAPA